ncbi:lysozyme [Aliihoeflea sp. PC F10.4]
MRVDFNVAMEVAAHEALVRQTYLDSKKVKTWCVGMTNATGHRVERYIGKPASLQHCMNVFAWALTNYARQVQEAFATRPLTQEQFAAALSFHWNTGAIKSATWVRYWLRGEDEKARKAFMNWITPKEIATRRGKERDLFFDGKWSNDGRMTEFTRVRASMAPDWSSGIKINVATELRNAFAEAADVVLDQQPDPDAVPAGPTLSPEGGEPVASNDPIIIEDNTMPAPVGHNGGPAITDDLSPIEQMNKPVQGAKGNLAAGGVGAALLVLASTAGWLPAAWTTSPDAMLALGIVVPWLGGLVGNFVGSYRAPDKRFQA